MCEVFLAAGRLNLDRNLFGTGCLLGGITSLWKDWKDGRSLLRSLDVGAGSCCDRHVGADSCGIGD